ncbi:hypothetical protein [Candidatus Thiosymbion oneisti]|uniref:hypothetical protein n=1 Tax=Candidatus Thiosymbion oneisti TaxID=589554 RepID=UPI0010618110|nr:hypothetical protein [Candidatus Thiosymbion oneisti]
MLVGSSGLARLGNGYVCRLFALMLCSSLSAGCGDVNADLLQQIGATVQARLADTRPLRLVDVTSFTWDRVAVFPPYTPRALVERTLGTSVPSGAVAIERRDDVCLLVFLRAGKVTEWTLLPRNLGDLSESGVLASLTPETAIFRVAEVDRGEPWILLIPAAPPVNSP